MRLADPELEDIVPLLLHLVANADELQALDPAALNPLERVLVGKRGSPRDLGGCTGSAGGSDAAPNSLPALPVVALLAAEDGRRTLMRLMRLRTRDGSLPHISIFSLLSRIAVPASEKLHEPSGPETWTQPTLPCCVSPRWSSTETCSGISASSCISREPSGNGLGPAFSGRGRRCWRCLTRIPSSGAGLFT